jgi:hypothetical protein
MPLWVLLILLLLGVKKIPLWIIIVGFFALDGVVRVASWWRGEHESRERNMPPVGQRVVPKRSESRRIPIATAARPEDTAEAVLIPAPNIRLPTPGRPYFNARIGELERWAEAAWNSVDRLAILSDELQYRSTRRSLNLRDSVDARISELREQRNTLTEG